MIDWLKRIAPEPELQLNDDAVPIVLRRLRSAKRLTLRLAPDGSEVRITLPRWASKAEAIEFAHSRADWLAEQRSKIPQRTRPAPGGQIDFRGKSAKLIWVANAPRTPCLRAGELTIGGPREGIESRLKRWMEREALEMFERDTKF